MNSEHRWNWQIYREHLLAASFMVAVFIKTLSFVWFKHTETFFQSTLFKHNSLNSADLVFIINWFPETNKNEKKDYFLIKYKKLLFLPEI